MDILALDGMNKKNQTAIEFMIVSGTILFLLVIFFVAVQASTAEKYREKENLIVRNLALSVQDEINMAADVSNGYVRIFNVPAEISGKSYEIKIVDNLIYIKTEKNSIALTVKEITGEIKKGANLIKRENDKIYLNP